MGIRFWRWRSNPLRRRDDVVEEVRALEDVRLFTPVHALVQRSASAGPVVVPGLGGGTGAGRTSAAA
ncbi:hypothetical protein AB0C98_08900 [Streptomyces sp. NPDC048558]|uniref:hypothetical protein n=1 Tax=Streptomyces sp. NPDC048558 TaxID=3155759 RepID=UPI0033C10C42